MHADMFVTDRYYALLNNDERQRRLLAMSSRPTDAPTVERYDDWGKEDLDIAELVAKLRPDSHRVFRNLLVHLAGAD